MAERQDKPKSAYEMGIDFYKDKITAILGEITPETDEYHRLVAQERVEELQLKIRQNGRRQSVLKEGKTMQDSNFGVLYFSDKS